MTVNSYTVNMVNENLTRAYKENVIELAMMSLMRNLKYKFCKKLR